MVKNLKRTLALMLSIIMIFSSTLTAFANDEGIIASSEAETSAQIEETVEAEEPSTEAPKVEVTTEEEKVEAATEAKKEEAAQAEKTEVLEDTTEEVKGKAAYKAELEDVAVYVGEDAVFTVKSDVAVKSCQWQMSKNGGRTWANLNKKQYGSSKTLTIKAKSDYNGRMFRGLVVFKNYSKATTNAVTLSVNEIPTYPERSFDYDKLEGIVIHVDAPEGALPEGFSMAAEKVSLSAVQDIVDMTEGIDGTVVTAVDITFFDKNGNEIEPNSQIGVSITSDEIAKIENPTVIHVDTNAEKIKTADVEAEEVEATTKDDTVKFTSDKFSVYAIVSDPTEYARAEVNFYRGTTKLATMYVKNNDTLEELGTILYDPGCGDLAVDEHFMGWTQDEDYNSSSDIKDIDGVRAEMEALEIVEGEEMTVINYYAAIAKIITLTYFDDKGVAVLKQQSANLVGSDANVEFEVKANFTPSEPTQNFEGWQVKSGAANIVSPAVPGEDEAYENGSTTLVVTGNVELIAYAPRGSWLVFDENGKGAPYCAPQFVKTDHPTKLPRPVADMTRIGYTFGGWHTVKYTDDDSPTEAELQETEFVFGGTLDDNTTIYAYWIPNKTAQYTVVFWTQNHNRTAYDLKDSRTILNGTVGQNIPYTSVNNGDEDYATLQGIAANTYHYTGFCLTEASKNQQIEITANGEAVLNLYYDRIVYNFKFYLYRDGTQNNRYDYANNSGNGSALNDLVTWHSNETAHPSVTGETIQSETVGGRTYHYFVMQAYYEEDISSKWPTYEKITGANGREAVSYVMMVGTKLKPNATNQGSGTVKGIITVMNENILGATNDANGNYVVIRFPDSYYNWRYHIWYEAANGVAPAGKTTHVYNGKTYYEDTVLTVRSSNTTDANQNEPKYQGFDYVTRMGQNAQGEWGGGHWTTNEDGTTLYHLNYIYNRQEFKVHYYDGIYVDSDNLTEVLYEHADQLLDESEPLAFGTTIPEDIQNYKPAQSHENGFVFEGWYADASCTVPMHWTTMPEGGIIVYAKWIQKEYRILMHPNAGASTDEGNDLDWGSDTVQMSFKLDYMGKVNTPTGTRTGYEFVGWYWDEGLSEVFLTNTAITDDDCSQYDNPDTEEYDPSDPTELDKWGNDTSGNGYNKDADNNRYWVVGKVDLYAKWIKIAEGAPGVQVVYDAGKGSEAPTDNFYYDDGTEAVAQGACKGYTETVTDPETGEEKEQKYVFDHWVVQKWNGTEYVDTSVDANPGGKFFVYLDDAKQEIIDQDPDTGKINEAKYTIQLRAEYVPVEEEVPTHIYWYANNGEYIEERDGADTSKVIKDDNVQINVGVDIPASNVFTYDGHKFLGWARLNGPTEENPTDPESQPINLSAADLFLKWVEPAEGETEGHYIDVESGKTVTQVAADEKHPYHDLYAVWENAFYVFHSSDGMVDTIGASELTDGKYDLTKAVKGDNLYGGYFMPSDTANGYLDVTDTKAIEAAQNNVAATTDTYDGTSTKSGDTKYWTKACAQTADGSKLVPQNGKVYYLREVPKYFLDLRVQSVYDKKSFEIEDLYLLTTIDNTIYDQVGFKIESDKKARFCTTVSIQMRNDTAVTTITAQDINKKGGYIGVWDEGFSSLIDSAAEGSEFSVTPYWITKDKIRVDDSHGEVTYNIGNKKYGDADENMHKVTP